MNILEKHTKFKKGELSKKSGVYIITNIINNKVYIGETTNLESRLIEHLRRLLSNKHVNEHLQNAVNLYGIETFGFDVLEFCESKDTKKREHYWVVNLHALDKEKGYNIKPTHPDKINLRSKETSKKIYETKQKKALERGYWFSEEDIKKRVISRKGYTHSEETKRKIGEKSKGRKNKIVLQYTLSGEFIKEWESLNALQNAGFNKPSIVEVCKNNTRRKKYKDYVWKYKEM